MLCNRIESSESSLFLYYIFLLSTKWQNITKVNSLCKTCVILLSNMSRCSDDIISWEHVKTGVFICSHTIFFFTKRNKNCGNRLSKVWRQWHCARHNRTPKNGINDFFTWASQLRCGEIQTVGSLKKGEKGKCEIIEGKFAFWCDTNLHTEFDYLCNAFLIWTIKVDLVILMRILLWRCCKGKFVSWNKKLTPERFR